MKRMQIIKGLCSVKKISADSLNTFSRMLPVLLGLWLLSASCEHKELCYPSSLTVEVRVLFDWGAVSGVAVEGMSVYFFPDSGGEPLRYDFAGTEGGTVKVPWGDYKVIYMNNDTETILFRNMEHYDSFEIYTRPTSLVEMLTSRSEPRGANPESAPVVLAPEAVWGGVREGIRLVRGEAETYNIVLPVSSRVCSYSFEIINVENLKYVQEAGASLSGLSGSLRMGGNIFSDVRSVIPFPAETDGKSSIKGHTLAFGLSTNADTSRVLTLYLVFADGSKHYYRFDVSDQVNNAPDKRNVHIVIDGLSLPKPIVNGGGFHPEVDEWETINIDMPM